MSRFLAAFFERVSSYSIYHISFIYHNLQVYANKHLTIKLSYLSKALDGLSWVASELTILERLLNVELTTREAGNTSTLLYDPADNTPSCFAVTW